MPPPLSPDLEPLGVAEGGQRPEALLPAQDVAWVGRRHLHSL